MRAVQRQVCSTARKKIHLPGSSSSSVIFST